MNNVIENENSIMRALGEPDRIEYQGGEEGPPISGNGVLCFAITTCSTSPSTDHEQKTRLDPVPVLTPFLMAPFLIPTFLETTVQLPFLLEILR